MPLSTQLYPSTPYVPVEVSTLGHQQPVYSTSIGAVTPTKTLPYQQRPAATRQPSFSESLQQPVLTPIETQTMKAPASSFSKPPTFGTPEITMTRDLTKGQKRNVTPTKTLMPVERNAT